MLKRLMNKYKTLPLPIKASFWFLICSFFQKGISVITTPIFTRIMSAEQYGSYSVYQSWLGIITIFATLSLSSGIYTQGLIKFDSERNKFASSIQSLCVTLVLCFFVVYLIFKEHINSILSLTTIQMISMFALMWSSTEFNFWAVNQRVDYKYKKLVFVSVAMSLIVPATGILMVINFEDKVTARIVGTAVVQLIAYAGFYILQLCKGKVFYSKEIWRYAIKFNLPLLPHYLAVNILSSADRIMIEKMIGPGSAGVYSLAYSVSNIMIIFNAALLQTIEPWLYKKIKENRTDEISKIAYPSFIVIAAVNIILIALAPEIISFFAPQEYFDAIWVVPPIAMSVFFMFVYSFFAAFEFYFEKTKYIILATSFGAVMNIILNYIFIRIFGYYAAGYTTLLCYLMYAIFHYIFMKKLCNKMLGGVSVYSIKIIAMISVTFVGIGIMFLFTYKYIVIRYILFGAIIMLSILNTKRIALALKTLLTIQKREEN